MDAGNSNWLLGRALVVFTAIGLGCVDPVNVSLPGGERPLVLEGHLSIDPDSPDTVWLSQAYPADGKYHKRLGVSGATLWITDDDGTMDVMRTVGSGVYVTDALQGVVGKTYTLNGILADGTVIESRPQRLEPAGNIDSIYYEQTSIRNSTTGEDEIGLNIFVDASYAPSSNRHMRWRFNGTYAFVSDPSLLTMPPLACAAGCVCCNCWASEREDLPLVKDATFLSGSTIKRVFVKYIPINGLTFYAKYRVRVTQMELSPEVFNFYDDIRKQMENGGSIFQPPFFELKGNILVVQGSTKVFGVFSASAEVKRVIDIKRTDVPYPGTSVLAGDCRAVVVGASIFPPTDWD